MPRDSSGYKTKEHLLQSRTRAFQEWRLFISVHQNLFTSMNIFIYNRSLIHEDIELMALMENKTKQNKTKSLCASAGNLGFEQDVVMRRGFVRHNGRERNFLSLIQLSVSTLPKCQCF